LGAAIDRAVEVHPAVLDAGRVAPHRLAAEGARARGELELPVVPLAGEHPVPHAPLRERIALVGAAVVDSVHALAHAHARIAPPARVLAQHRGAFGERVQRSEIGPVGLHARMVRDAGGARLGFAGALAGCQRIAGVSPLQPRQKVYSRFELTMYVALIAAPV